MERLEYINPFSKKARELSREFDACYEIKDKQQLLDMIEKAKLYLKDENIASRAQICYSIGTTYGDLLSMISLDEREEFQNNQIYYLRESIYYIESDEINIPEYVPYVNGFKLNLYTNYANALENIGRKIAAIEQYKKVLLINPNFGMALGNLGVAYQHYGILEYDEVHRDYFHNSAYHLLNKAINSNDPSVYDGARKYFCSVVSTYNHDYVENVLKKTIEFPPYTYEEENEYMYRNWVLEQGLFLNSLNDLNTEEMCIAGDVLQLPNMIVKIEDKPTFHGMFNQFKQEYIFARYQYYCVLNASEKEHFADRETYLVNLYDYPQYSIRVEMIKSSFKILYSLLDKIAFFINLYFDLGINERDVSFHNVWMEEKKGKNGYKYKNVLKHQENFALSSIYWISKDFYTKLCYSPNPQAKRIKDIRNALEHRYVKIIWGLFDESLANEIDDQAFYITESELYQETYNLLKLIREVLICLCFAVSIEEQKRKDKSDIDLSKIPKVSFIEYDDKWKI